jgi:hypothetical protein
MQETWEIVVPLPSGGQFRLDGSNRQDVDHEVGVVVHTLTDGLRRAGYKPSVTVHRDWD